MDVESILRYIEGTFAGVETLEATGTYFLFVGPDRMMPFVTIVTNDDHDTESNLSRPGAFRLNVGVSKSTFESLFAHDQGPYDFTALDTVMPHPVYAPQHWLCVLNPSAATFESVKPLLAEAHARAAERDRKRSQGG